MRCRIFRSRVVAYSDGELPDEEVRWMEQHAQSCPDCSLELEAVREETRLYEAAFREHRAPEDLAEGVMGALEGVHVLPAAQTPSASRGVPMKWVVTISSAAAVLVMLLFAGAAYGPLAARKAAAPAPTTLWAHSETVQAGGYLETPSGGRIYASRPEVEHEPMAHARSASAVLLVGWDGRPLHQPDPSFRVEERKAVKGEPTQGVRDLNEALLRPQAVTEHERQTLNALAQPSASMGGPSAAPGAAGAPLLDSEAAVGVAPPAPPPGPAVVVDSTDARVVLTVDYQQEDDQYVTVYDVDFSADYVIRAPDLDKEAVRIAVTFPFPLGCETVSGAKLAVDEKTDEEHTTYSVTGIRWVNWFEPGKSKTLTIAYTARGLGNYRYVLDKNNMARRFRLLMKVNGVEPGRAVEIPTDSLVPTKPGRDVEGNWDYAWEYARLLTTKDIAVNFPAKEAPTTTANHVMETVGRNLSVARFAPLFLVLFLAALALGGMWNRGHALKMEELGLLGIAFLLFYPLFLFGAAYVGRNAALVGAVAIVTVLSAAYVSKLRGGALATRVALLNVVLLGAFTYALFDRAFTGLIFTAGATALVGYFMLLHGRRAADHAAGDPAEVARAHMPPRPDGTPGGGTQG